MGNREDRILSYGFGFTCMIWEQAMGRGSPLRTTQSRLITSLRRPPALQSYSLERESVSHVHEPVPPMRGAILENLSQERFLTNMRA